ncbi:MULTISPECIES: M56 family metallopeptidase [Prauserella]|uniref:Peptidase n=2 Tax=Prauserella TaxID=142577 RepID=A0A318L9A8_9PSEU|nr:MULTISPECIES: M56 family metallopeptidase [Prauserella]PXY17546.1 peptidase [Prauserella flavalba]PXY18595.1 peptidase [Prauserella coralliicola]TKG63527.1 M56 family metallopeptidase [Prauserella endophytica]
MTIAVALLAGALAVGWLVPGVLRRADLRRRDPLLLIVAWLISMAGVVLAAAAGVLLLLTPGHGAGAPLLVLIDRCWSAVQHGSPPRVEEFAGLLGLALLGAFAVRLVVVSIRGARRRARKRQENLSLLRLAARKETGPPDTLWLAHDRPLAFSMAGRPGVVVATEGLTRHLDDHAVAAVLTHEQAHLAGRHHLLVATADALRAALPFVPLFTQAPRAIRELAELAADTAAVRHCGPAAVRTALQKVSSHGAPSASLAMAQEAVDLRLARLRHGSVPPGGLRRAISCGITGVTAAALPFLAGAVLLLLITLVSCR